MNALITSSLMAASMVLGQAAEPTPGVKTTGAPTVTVQQGPIPIQRQSAPIQQTQTQQPQAQPPLIQQPTTQPSRPLLGWFGREDRPLMSKISSWWKREPEPRKDIPNLPAPNVLKETPAIPTSRPTPVPTEFPRKLPNPQSKGPSPANSPVPQNTLTPASLTKSVKSPILPQFANKMGRDEKFEWVTGQLEYENGNFILYYSTPETIDKYHGRIVLQPQQVDLKQFKIGDLVSMRGQISERKMTLGVVPVYHVHSASLIERPKL